MTTIRRSGASWNRDWAVGEHGGESFETTDAIIDIVNPQQRRAEKVFVGGSRGFEAHGAVIFRIAGLQKGSVVLVSPTHGAAAAARDAALRRGLEVHVYIARFEKYPTAESAYFARDEEMIRDADRALVFWDGRSPGTSHEIEYAREIGKPIGIHMLDLGGSTYRPARPPALLSNACSTERRPSCRSREGSAPALHARVNSPRPS